MKPLIAFTMAIFMLSAPACAESGDKSESGFDLPRMVSLRSNNVNSRTGPDKKYPIEWIYHQKGAPVEIVNEFGLWRKIKDWEGSESWVHKSLLTGVRFVRIMVPGENNIYNRASYQSKVIAKAEDGVIGEIKRCRKVEDFCLIKFDTVEGWVPKSILFGLYPDEDID